MPLKKPAIVAQPSHYDRIIAPIRSIVDDAPIRDGVICVTDPAHVALIRAEGSFFEKMPDCDIDLDALMDAIRAFDPKADVALHAPLKSEIDSPTGDATNPHHRRDARGGPVRFHDGIHDKTRFLTQAPMMALSKVPNFGAHARTHTVRAGTMQGALKHAEGIEDHIQFTSTNQRLALHCIGDDGSVASILEAHARDDGLGELVSLFSIDYLRNTFRTMTPATKVDVTIRQDMPLVLEWAYKDAKYIYLLAPRIKSE